MTDVRQAIEVMLRDSGMTGTELSRSVGRNPSYVSGARRLGSVPRVDTMAKLAHACGYRLFLVRWDGRGVELYGEHEGDGGQDA